MQAEGNGMVKEIIAGNYRPFLAVLGHGFGVASETGPQIAKFGPRGAGLNFTQGAAAELAGAVLYGAGVCQCAHAIAIPHGLTEALGLRLSATHKIWWYTNN